MAQMDGTALDANVIPTASASGALASSRNACESWELRLISVLVEVRLIDGDDVYINPNCVAIIDAKRRTIIMADGSEYILASANCIDDLRIAMRRRP